MSKLKRRDFIKGAVATGAIAAAPFNILKAGPSPNSKLNIAGIGIGGQGSRDADHLAINHNIIGIADADWKRHNECIKGKERLQGIKMWHDYRKMFDDIGDKIDAVVIATPDHARCGATMFCIRHGKHVYAEKPMAHNIAEIRMMTEESKKYNVLTQLGHQGHSYKSTAMTYDWVRGGCIGPVREVNAYMRKNYYTNSAPNGDTKPYDGIDWNIWLNRAEMIPYNESYMHREWIRFSHFSGQVGDMAAHTLDPAYYSLDLRVPVSVRAENVIKSPIDPKKVDGLALAKAGVVIWEFPSRAGMPPVTMRYYLGPDIEYPRPKDLEKDRDASFLLQGSGGSVIVGEKGSIMSGSHGQSSRIIPEARMREVEQPPERAHRIKGGQHLDNWTMSILGEDRIMSPFEYSGPLSEICALGDIALAFPGEKLEWDGDKMEFTNNEEANKCMFLRRRAPRDDMNWY